MIIFVLFFSALVLESVIARQHLVLTSEYRRASAIDFVFFNRMLINYCSLQDLDRIGYCDISLSCQDTARYARSNSRRFLTEATQPNISKLWS